MDPKKYIEEFCQSVTEKVDCFIVYKTKPPHDSIVGMPLGVFRTKPGLCKAFPKIVEETDEKWGVTIGTWNFDD
jgi:hypothetical protein